MRERREEGGGEPRAAPGSSPGDQPPEGAAPRPPEADFEFPDHLEAGWRPRAPHPVVRALWIVSATAVSVMGGFMLYYAITVPWFEQEAFDILGVLFLLSNLPRLVSWAGALVCVPLAVALGYTAYRGDASWMPRYRGSRLRRRRPRRYR